MSVFTVIIKQHLYFFLYLNMFAINKASLKSCCWKFNNNKNLKIPNMKKKHDNYLKLKTAKKKLL